MAKSIGKSYLKLATLPELGSMFLSPVPVVVFDADLRKILWSNAPGAKLFGGLGIADLINMELPETNSLMFQLRHTADSLSESEDRIVRGFRLGSGTRARLLQFELAGFETEKGEHLVRISHLDEPENTENTEQSALTALEGISAAAAIVNQNGELLFTSPGLESLNVDDELRNSLPSLIKKGSTEYGKAKLRSQNGGTISVRFARLKEDQKRILVLFDLAKKSDAVPQGSEPTPLRVVPHLTDEGTQAPTEQDTSQGTDEVQDETETGDFEKAELESETVGIQYEPDATSTDAESPPVADAEPDRRFAWSTDPEGRIISVSQDFAQYVGDTFSNIEGKRWSDISQAYDLDPEGEVSRLLSLENTWSGKTVFWPTGEDGTKRAEIVLAALPAYDNNRSFSGFRGYGKWIAEAHGTFDTVEPEIPELEQEVSEGSSNSEITEIERDPISSFAQPNEEDDEPDYKIQPTPENDNDQEGENSYPDNIVAFSSPNRAKQELTDGEQRAFRSVKERLSIVGEEEGEEQIDSATDAHGLLEKLSVAVLVYSGDSILFANRNFLNASGYEDLEQLSGSAGLEDLLKGIDSYEEGTQTSLKRRDGRLVPIKPVLHTVPWRGEKAALLSFAPPVVIPDMSSANPESRIKEIQGILDTTSDGIVLLDSKGKVISFNASAEALFGIEFEEAEGRELPEFFADESRQAAEEYVSSVMESGPDQLINEGAELIAQEAGGGLIPLFVTLNRMDATGKLCAVLRDITTWKKAEEELVQSRREAERANDQKSEFLAQVSHEIRTPLNAIIGFSDVMIDERFGPIQNERYREYLRDIKRSGTHVLEIVNGLLDLSRIEAGKLELTFEAVDLNELVAETVALLQPQANASRTIIRTSLSRSVPKVVADQRSIRQIILNLVSNAIKYSNNNGQVIVSTVYDANGEVALRVRDTGKGMSEDQIELAMQPFQQAHDMTKPDASGYGLGLPLTKALVEANRAYFELESEPGEGTIAHVQFPTQRVLND